MLKHSPVYCHCFRNKLFVYDTELRSFSLVIKRFRLSNAHLISYVEKSCPSFHLNFFHREETFERRGSTYDRINLVDACQANMIPCGSIEFVECCFLQFLFLFSKLEDAGAPTLWYRYLTQNSCSVGFSDFFGNCLDLWSYDSSVEREVFVEFTEAGRGCFQRIMSVPVRMKASYF